MATSDAGAIGFDAAGDAEKWAATHPGARAETHVYAELYKILEKAERAG